MSLTSYSGQTITEFNVILTVRQSMMELNFMNWTWTWKRWTLRDELRGNFIFIKVWQKIHQDSCFIFFSSFFLYMLEINLSDAYFIYREFLSNCECSYNWFELGKSEFFFIGLLLFLLTDIVLLIGVWTWGYSAFQRLENRLFVQEIAILSETATVSL